MTTHTLLDLSGTDFVPCVNDGAGEWMVVEGKARLLYHRTVNEAGTFLYRFMFHPQRYEGYGLTTGTRYQGSGHVQDIWVQRGDGTYPFTWSLHADYRWSGQGSGNNYVAHERYHVTVDARGETRVDRVTRDYSCGADSKPGR